MKSFKKFRLLISTIVFTILLTAFVYAGTGVIQFGDPTVTRDKTFNLAMKVKSTDVRLKTADITIEYNPSMMEFISGTNAEGGAGTVRINGTGEGKGSGTRTLEYQLKFKAIYAGVANVTILDQEVTDTTDNFVNITKLGTSKVTIKPSNTTSKNANLATFEFSPGELDREFDASVLSYNTEVNADVTSMVISAVPEDKDAKVSITGNENLATGMNKVNIAVTAPDGKTKKEYVLNVTKLETGVTDGNTTITNGQKMSSKNIVITIMIKPEDVNIPSGYKKLSGEFGGNTIEAYGPDNTPENETPEVFLIYGMNQDGIVDFYRNDTRNGDNTIQRYIEEPYAGEYAEISSKYDSTKDKYNNLVKRYNIIFPVCIGLAGLSLILIITLIFMIINSGKTKVKKDPYEDDDDDDDDYFTKNSRVTEAPRKIDYYDDDLEEARRKDNTDDDNIEDLG